MICTSRKGILLGALVLGTWVFGRMPVPRPDIVLVSVDCMRADHLGCYGYPRATSPTIDALSRRGTLFTRAVSASDWTLASVGTFLTGVLPSRHGGVTPLEPVQRSWPLLPELLAKDGYETAVFACEGYVEDFYGLRRGFDKVWHVYMEEADAQAMVSSCIEWLRARSEKSFFKKCLQGILARPRKPLFLWVHFLEPHAPYTPRQPYYASFHPGPDAGGLALTKTMHLEPLPVRNTPELREQLTAMYDSEIRYADDALARLLAEFDPATTIFTVTADHGEELGERGRYGHGYMLNSELTRVPLILAGPGVPAGLIVTEPVGTIDLAPTVLASAGLPIPSHMEGVPLQKALFAGPGQVSRTIISEEHQVGADFECYSTLVGKSRTIIHQKRDSDESCETFLFDWDADLVERNNLYKPTGPGHRAETDRLLAHAREARARIRGFRREQAGLPGLDEERIRQLTQLGYLR